MSRRFKIEWVPVVGFSIWPQIDHDQYGHRLEVSVLVPFFLVSIRFGLREGWG